MIPVYPPSQTLLCGLKSTQTQTYKTYIHQHIFSKINPFNTTLAKKNIYGTDMPVSAIIPSSLLIPDFFFKGMIRNNNKKLNIYKCITTNTSVKWKQVAHTTYHQLLAAQQEPFNAKYWRILQDLYKKALSLRKKYRRILCKEVKRTAH